MIAMRVALYGNFGAGNLGNECTLQAVSERIRRQWPDAEIFCVCTDPGDVKARHGMQAVPAALDRTRAAGAGRALPRPLRLIFHRLPLELIHSLRCLGFLLRTDLLVVPGTGIVSDHLCGPYGWPYDLFKWSMLAALCRVELAFVSIGAGPLRHPVSRWLIGRSLASASYRSYRDEATKRYLQEIGVRTSGDAVYPDLVFGLSSVDRGSPPGVSEGPRIVGLGVKDYAGVSGGREATGAYRRYLEAMADFVSWLQQRGWGVRLLIGDLHYDSRARGDLIETLRRRAVAVEPPRLIAEHPVAVGDLLRQLAECDVVISPRFHNLVLATMLGRPVIALSDHVKLDALVAGLGLARYRVPLESIDAGTLIDRFGELEAEEAQLRLLIGRQVERNREAVEEQYARLFGTRRADDDLHADEAPRRVRRQPRAASR